MQALVDHTRFASPRRVAQGVDANRLAMLLAVMSRHSGVVLSEHDVYVNLVGGLQIAETATDLPLALALASSLRGEPLDPALVAFGELGTHRRGATGPARRRAAARAAQARLHPRYRAQAKCPARRRHGLRLEPVATVAEALEAAFGSASH